MSLWRDPALPAPFYPDVLDDLFPAAMQLADEYSDLTTEFDDFMDRNGKHVWWGLTQAQKDD